MSVASPHYLLFSEACHAARRGNAWRFVLESVNSQQRLAATDVELHAGGERLELLAVVRGLEALDAPSRVTLITKSRYVSRGLKYGMNDWRANGWQWERFGKLVPVRDHDLWRRVDRALQFHQVQCRAWQFDPEADLCAKALAEQPATKPGYRVKKTTGPCESSPKTTRVPGKTTRYVGESHVAMGPRKANHRMARRRLDPGHLPEQGKHPNTNSQSPACGHVSVGKRAPARKGPTRKNKHFARQAQGILTRLKWSLSTWLAEQRLQPLA